MSKAQVFALLIREGSHAACVTDSNGQQHWGIPQRVEREDGSGRCFNITIRLRMGQLKTVFVRTKD